MKEMFICDSCQRVFDNKDACKAHEFWCHTPAGAGTGKSQKVRLSLSLKDGHAKVEVFGYNDEQPGGRDLFDGKVHMSPNAATSAEYVIRFDTGQMAQQEALHRLLDFARRQVGAQCRSYSDGVSLCMSVMAELDKCIEDCAGKGVTGNWTEEK